MPANEAHNSKVRKTVNDLVMAEMFLLQATIESATVIGDGINELMAANDENEKASGDSFGEVLQRIKDDALEPYTTRYEYFKRMINS